MGKKMPDGSVVSSFFDVKEAPTSREATRQDRILEGQIVRIHYTDDPTNRSKQFVEYDVIAREAYGQAVTYKNCRNAMDFGGTNNFSEVILENNEFAFQGKLQDSNFPANMNGTMVKIAFLENLDKPVIIGGSTHKKFQPATRKDGIRLIKEFNGVKTNINKDGEWSQTHLGPRKPNGELTRPDTGTTSFSVDKKGDYEFKQEKEEELINSEKFEREAKKVTRKVGNDTLVEEWDGENEKKTLTTKSGLQVTEDGKNDKTTLTTAGGLQAEHDGSSDKITYTTSGGLTVEYDGSGDKVTFTTSGGPTVTVDGAGTITIDANGTIVNIDGSSGKIELTGAAVDVGEAATALAALGPQLISWLSSHVHTGNLGSPTSPPNVPPPASLLSTSVKLKS